MRRRVLFASMAGAALLLGSVRAQQKAMPVIGVLNGGSPGSFRPVVAAFRQGLSETGYVEGQNAAQMPEAAGPFHHIKSAKTGSHRTWP